MAAEITLEALGLKAEDIADRVVDRIAEQMLTKIDYDEDERPHHNPSPFRAALQQRIKDRIDRSIDEIAAKHVLPNITEYLEGLCLQETNRWGEKTGKPLTFIEYLAQRADAYMKEEVNYSGKTKEEDSYSWRKNTTRVSYLIHQHLQFSIEKAMKAALRNANNSIIGGIQKAVEVSLSSLKIEMKAPEVKS
ncbi:MAG: hypothetical protein ACK4JB_20145 [Reyranella sp.]